MQTSWFDCLSSRSLRSFAWHRTDVQDRVGKVLGQIADDPVGRLPFPVGLLLAPPILDDARRRERDFVPGKDFAHADRVTQRAEKLNFGFNSLKTALPHNINDVFQAPKILRATHLPSVGLASKPCRTHASPPIYDGDVTLQASMPQHEACSQRIELVELLPMMRVRAPRQHD